MEVGISQQQALTLLPLLQKIAEGAQVPQVSTPSRSSSGSSPVFSPPPPNVYNIASASGYSTDTSENACRYSSDELFQTKPRNSKSPFAHTYCHVSSCMVLDTCLCMFR